MVKSLRFFVPRFVIVFICLWGLAIVRLGLVAALRFSLRQDVSSLLDRVTPLKPWLKDEKIVGYVEKDEKHKIVAFGNDHHFSALQYVLSPVLVRHYEKHPDCPLVIVDSDDPSALQSLVNERGWTLIVDLGNGINLYRQAAGGR